MKRKKNTRAAPTAKKFPTTGSKSKVVLRLFVAGATNRSRQAILHVQEHCATIRAGRCTLEVVDIYQQPELARVDQIVATPTLIVDFPRPARRFIGNLANLAGLFDELDLSPAGKIAV